MAVAWVAPRRGNRQRHGSHSVILDRTFTPQQREALSAVQGYRRRPVIRAFENQIFQVRQWYLRQWQWWFSGAFTVEFHRASQSSDREPQGTGFRSLVENATFDHGFTAIGSDRRGGLSGVKHNNFKTTHLWPRRCSSHQLRAVESRVSPTHDLGWRGREAVVSKVRGQLQSGPTVTKPRGTSVQGPPCPFCRGPLRLFSRGAWRPLQVQAYTFCLDLVVAIFTGAKRNGHRSRRQRFSTSRRFASSDVHVLPGFCRGHFH